MIQGSQNKNTPQFLADQLTLSQPGGHIMPTTLLRATPDIQTLRQPYSDLAKLKSGQISVFEVGGSFFLDPILSRKAFATNSLK